MKEWNTVVANENVCKSENKLNEKVFVVYRQNKQQDDKDVEWEILYRNLLDVWSWII